MQQSHGRKYTTMTGAVILNGARMQQRNQHDRPGSNLERLKPLRPAFGGVQVDHGLTAFNNDSENAVLKSANSFAKASYR